MTHLTESNSNPTLHAKSSNCVAYASAIRLAISNKGGLTASGHVNTYAASDIATTDFLPWRSRHPSHTSHPTLLLPSTN